MSLPDGGRPENVLRYKLNEKGKYFCSPTDPVPPEESDPSKADAPVSKENWTLCMVTSSRVNLMYPYRIRVENPACQYHDCEKDEILNSSSGSPENLWACYAI